MSTSNLQVAQTILEQLGGNRFIAMTGSKMFVGSDSYLRFQLVKNRSKATHCEIRLESTTDLYTVTFTRYNRRTVAVDTVATFSDVYADSLRRIFTTTTGLETSL